MTFSRENVCPWAAQGCPADRRVMMSRMPVMLCGGRGMCAAAVFLLSFLTTQAPAGGSPDSSELHFSTLRGQSGFWRIGKTDSGVWWFINPKDQPDFLNMVTTVQPLL